MIKQNSNYLMLTLCSLPKPALKTLLSKLLFFFYLVNCPVGYFFNITDCEACPVDQYQDEEAQSFCFDCPTGTSTFGGRGAKRSENCEGHKKYLCFLFVCLGRRTSPPYLEKGAQCL